MNFRLILPWLVLPMTALTLLACGGGGGGGNGGGGGGGACLDDTSDIGDGTGTIVQGVVRNQNLTGVANAQVEFYTSGGVLIKRGRTSCTGNFAVQLASLPARLSIQRTSIYPAHYGMFQYQGAWFTTATNCRAPITGINVGGTTNLPTIYLSTASGPPPPPPTGCL